MGKESEYSNSTLKEFQKKKSDLVARLAYDNQVDVILLQETHVKSEQDLLNRGTIKGFDIAGYIISPVYGITTYVSDSLLDYDITYSDNSNDIFVINLLIGGLNVINIYKPPSIMWPVEVLPAPAHPCFLGGDFNSHHNQWGYARCDRNGDVLYDFFTSNDLHIIFTAKDKPTFHSARWNTGTNPDLSVISSSISNIARRAILAQFPRSQHCPVLTDISLSIPIIESCPKNRWNFDKADWMKFQAELEHVITFIPVKVGNYDRFCGLFLEAFAKNMSPVGIPGVMNFSVVMWKMKIWISVVNC